MKNKPSVLRKPVIAQGGPPRDLPMKTDELLNMIEKSYNESAYLQHRHALPDNLMGTIAVVDALAAKAAE